MNPTVQSSGSLIRSQLSMNLPSLKKGRQNPINKISYLLYSRVFQAAFGRLSVQAPKKFARAQTSAILYTDTS